MCKNIFLSTILPFSGSRFRVDSTAAQSTRILSSIFDVSSLVKSLPFFTHFGHSAASHYPTLWVIKDARSSRKREHRYAAGNGAAASDQYNGKACGHCVYPPLCLMGRRFGGLPGY